MVDERNNVKIIDFGFSVCTPPDSKLRIFCGTPSYMAPEIVSKKDYNGFATDVWSLGVILYLMLSGMYPFKAATERELYQKINKGYYSMPENIPNDAKRLIARMLSLEAQKRPSLKDVSAISDVSLVDMHR